MGTGRVEHYLARPSDFPNKTQQTENDENKQRREEKNVARETPPKKREAKNTQNVCSQQTAHAFEDDV